MPARARALAAPGPVHLHLFLGQRARPAPDLLADRGGRPDSPARRLLRHHHGPEEGGRTATAASRRRSASPRATCFSSRTARTRSRPRSARGCARRCARGTARRAFDGRARRPVVRRARPRRVNSTRLEMPGLRSVQRDRWGALLLVRQDALRAHRRHHRRRALRAAADAGTRGHGDRLPRLRPDPRGRDRAQDPAAGRGLGRGPHHAVPVRDQARPPRAPPQRVRDLRVRRGRADPLHRHGAGGRTGPEAPAPGPRAAAPRRGVGRRGADRGRPRRHPPCGRRPPRPEGAQHHARRARRGAGDGLRHRQGPRHGVGRAPPSPGRSSAPRST